MSNKISVGSGLRTILGFLFVLSLMLLSKNSKAYQTNIEWDLRGDDLYYVIISADSLGGNSRYYKCGNKFQSGKCYVFLTLDAAFGIEKYTQWKDYQYALWGDQTATSIIKEWSYNSLPRSGVIRNWFDHVANGRKCIYLFTSSDINGGLNMFGNSCSGSITPPPIEPPLPPLSCAVKGNIDLAHGILNQDNVNGNTKSVYAQVSCNREATVKITALANDGGDVVTLRADGSLKTKLQVNNIAGATGATVRVPGSNGTSVIFSSTLSSNGNVAAGDFSASAVAVVAIL